LLAPMLLQALTSFADTFVPGGTDDAVLVSVIKMSTWEPQLPPGHSESIVHAVPALPPPTQTFALSAVPQVVPADGKIGSDPLA
jgi:hypothetical protein